MENVVVSLAPDNQRCDADDNLLPDWQAFDIPMYVYSQELEKPFTLLQKLCIWNWSLVSVRVVLCSAVLLEPLNFVCFHSWSLTP